MTPQEHKQTQTFFKTMATKYKVTKYQTGPTAYGHPAGCTNCGGLSGAIVPQHLIPPPSNRALLTNITDAEDPQAVHYGFFRGDVAKMKSYAWAQGYAPQKEVDSMDSTEVATLIFNNLRPAVEPQKTGAGEAPKIGNYAMEFVRDGEVQDVAAQVKKGDLKKALTALGIRNDNPKATPEEMVIVLQTELKRRYPAAT
jgi:hypothetical protein